LRQRSGCRIPRRQEAGAISGFHRDHRRRCVRVRLSVGQGRLSFAITALLGAGLLCAPANAADGASVGRRITQVFSVVPHNLAHLAVPLTRRALTWRINKNGALALSYRAPSTVPDPALLLRQPAAAEIAEGDADLPDDMVRLPRPRPGTPERVAPERVAFAAPIDLVAGAPLAPGEEANSDKPADLLAAVPGEDVAPETAAAPPAAPAAPAAAPIAAAPPAAAPAAAPARPEDPPAAAPAVAENLTTVAAADAAGPGAPAVLPAGDCLAPAKVTDADGDFRRNEAALSAAGLCIAVERFKEQRRPWTIQRVESGRPGPLWLVMHDNEDLAFDTAVYGLATYGGTLLAVETGGKRNQDGIDPNRNFSADGIGCSKAGTKRSPKFTEIFRSRYDDRAIIVLHNNDDGPIPTGGRGHVSMDSVPKSMRAAKSSEPDGPLAGKHALVLLAAADLEAEALKSRMAGLSGKGINVVAEPVRAGRGDCSLSNDVVLTGHADYFNVTVDHGEADKQRRIVDAIVSGFPTVTARRGQS
jgi:hypothetical protein